MTNDNDYNNITMKQLIFNRKDAMTQRIKQTSNIYEYQKI